MLQTTAQGMTQVQALWLLSAWLLLCGDDDDSRLVAAGGADAQDHDNSSLANTRVCQVCQGSGLQTEVYEFRRMEVGAVLLSV